MDSKTNKYTGRTVVHQSVQLAQECGGDPLQNTFIVDMVPDSLLKMMTSAIKVCHSVFAISHSSGFKTIMTSMDLSYM